MSELPKPYTLADMKTKYQPGKVYRVTGECILETLQLIEMLRQKPPADTRELAEPRNAIQRIYSIATRELAEPRNPAAVYADTGTLTAICTLIEESTPGEPAEPQCKACYGTGDGDYDLTDSGSGRRVDCEACKGTGKPVVATKPKAMPAEPAREYGDTK